MNTGTDKEKIKKKKVALALQGGGALGAFTWGVLEAFLCDERIEITGISGTSAGAMNALALQNGYIKNKNQGAIDSLKLFWDSASEIALKSVPALCDPIGNITGEPNLLSSMLFLNPIYNFIFNYLSPYIWNPYNINYFKDFCNEFFDIKAIRRSKNPKLFLTATHVETGKIKVFKNSQIDIDVMMATGCVPRVFQAPSINGEYYWDGGLVANPAIYPLIYANVAKDIVIVQLTRNISPGLPKTAYNIQHRFNEIALNSSLIREMRSIYLLTKLIDEGKILDKKIPRINLNIIKNDILFSRLHAGSMLNMNKEFLYLLHNYGIKTGKKWIHDNFDTLGKNMPFSSNLFREYISDF